MFDFRYHALSLAAVLLALALGVVIGVAIGDSSLVSSAKSGIVAQLNSEVNDSQHEAGQLRAQLRSQEAFTSDLYPVAVHERLAGRSIGLVFLGGSSDRVNALVRNAVAQAGGALLTVIAVREPLDLAGLARQAAGTRFAALGTASSPAASTAARANSQLTRQLGALVGRQLVSGGPNVAREFISRVRASLLSAFDGQLSRLDGLVVVRDEPAGTSAEEAQASAVFEDGLIKGVAAAKVTTVGAELSSTQPSQVPWYQARGISSVDDLDAIAGQAALIYALSGFHGAFGAKSTAASLLPNVAATGTQP
jgi:hypothetical protein